MPRPGARGRDEVGPTRSPSRQRYGQVQAAAAGLAVLRGDGITAVKSAELLPVSVHPAAARTTAVVFESEGAGDPSAHTAVLVP